MIEVPNYTKLLPLVDKGETLYYYSLYQIKEVHTRVEAIDALSYGLHLYTKKELKEREDGKRKRR